VSENESRPQPFFWIIIGLAAVALALFGLVWLTVPRGYPDEAQARRDFLAEHPTFLIERISINEQEVVAATFRIFYRTPGDTTVKEEFKQYFHSDGAWRITHRATKR
jgi:hypothetical protein